MQTLWLIETKAKNTYECSACKRIIHRGTSHFRHDPHPYARMNRGEQASHWCHACILASDPGLKDTITGRIRVPAIRVVISAAMNPGQLHLFQPVQIEIINVGELLYHQLSANPLLVHQLSPTSFQELICERLSAMGLEPVPVGHTYSKDGGVDILFYPRLRPAFPFLGAVQVKHHRDPDKKQGPSVVRDFAGTIAHQQINAGIIVTNIVAQFVKTPNRLFLS